MINRKEELAEYILKNLVFISLFVVFCFYGISLIILPKIQDLHSKQEAFRQEQFFEAKLRERNQAKQEELKIKQEENKQQLLALQQAITPIKLQAIAQEFFEVDSITESQSTPKDDFIETSLAIKGKSNGTKAIFDFIDKIGKLYPNATFALPLEMTKQDVLTNTLNISLLLKVTKLDSKKSQ